MITVTAANKYIIQALALLITMCTCSCMLLAPKEPFFGARNIIREDNESIQLEYIEELSTSEKIALHFYSNKMSIYNYKLDRMIILSDPINIAAALLNKIKQDLNSIDTREFDIYKYVSFLGYIILLSDMHPENQALNSAKKIIIASKSTFAYIRDNSKTYKSYFSNFENNLVKYSN